MLLHFPSAATIEQSIMNNSLFDIDFYKEKGITEAIAKLAGRRFANEELNEPGLKTKIKGLIYDLQKGVDHSTGEALPNLGKLGLSLFTWSEISKATKYALQRCATKA